MAAPMTIRRALYRFKSFCRHRIESKRYATSTATKEKKDPKLQKLLPWEDKPVGEVLFMTDHPQFIYKFEDALKMHKEAAQPAMGDNLQARIYADMILNFSTKKVTKPMKHSVDIIRFPHKFDSGQENKFMVFTEDEDTLELAQSLGTICGGTELIEQMVLGRVHKDDITGTDFVLATPDIFSKLMKVRSILKIKFPSRQAGTVGEDIKAMMDTLNQGLRYATDKTPVDLGARVQIPFGQLYQEDEILAENFDFMIQHLFQKKNESLPPYVNEVTLIAPPSEEKFLLNMKYIKRKPVETPRMTDKTAEATTVEPVQTESGEKASEISENITATTVEPVQSQSIEKESGIGESVEAKPDQSEAVQEPSEMDESLEATSAHAVEHEAALEIENVEKENKNTEVIKAEDQTEIDKDTTTKGDESSDSSDSDGSSSDDDSSSDEEGSEIKDKSESAESTDDEVKDKTDK